MRTLIALALLCLGSAASAAEVYRWVDDKGVVHYSDKPQSPADKPAALPHLQTYAHGTNPPGFAPVQSAKPDSSGGGKPAAFAITSPQNEETIRDAENGFTVTVSGNLQAGEGVIYYLDGAPANEQPTPSTAFLIAKVERGEHSISAALIGSDGKELERTAAVTVYVKPPTVKH